MILKLNSTPAYWLTCCKTIEARREKLLEALHKASIDSPTQIVCRITDPYYVGLAEGHVKALTNGKPPFIIFEDDSRILPEKVQTSFVVPDTADALYLGTNTYGRIRKSTGNHQVVAAEVTVDYLRAYNMLGLHAVAYLSERYVEHTANVLLKYIRDPQGACDDPVADSMHLFNVLCLRRPLFYCDDGKANICTSEPITPAFLSYEY